MYSKDAWLKITSEESQSIKLQVKVQFIVHVTLHFMFEEDGEIE